MLSGIIFGVGIDMLSDVMFGVGVDILPDIEIIVMDTLEFWGEVADAVDVLTAVIVGVVSSTDVDMLTDENENGLATATSALEFTLPAP